MKKAQRSLPQYRRINQDQAGYRCARRFKVLLSMACIAASAHSTAMPHQRATLATHEVKVEVVAETAVPALKSFVASNGVTWQNTIEEKLPVSVEIDGRQVDITWSLLAGRTINQRDRVAFVYESKDPHLQLEWEWRARAKSGPVEHRITIHNLSGKTLWLPLVDSLHFGFSISPDQPIHNFYVEKGADTPSVQGIHQDEVNEGYRWIGRSSTYAHPEPGEAREIIPVVFVGEGTAYQNGWFAGIEFSGRTRITLERRDNLVASRLGLNDELGPFRTRLDPGGSFETPVVFLGAFQDNLDAASNQLRSWVRTVLNHPATVHNPEYPLTVSNSWGSGMQVDETLALRMIADAHELGLEMFHLDAGWFRAVGDWHPDPVKFPHGLAYIADQAHRAGLRFGIWVDWSQAGTSTSRDALNVHQPRVRDWLVNDVPADWKPEEFKGQTIDLGVPAAQDYAAHELHRIARDYHLDMLEHDGYLVAQGCTRLDHPHAAPDRSSISITRDSGFEFVRSSNSTDVSYHAVRAYYSLYEQLRRDYPQMMLEICNDGGRMVDFGSAAHGDYFSITDTYDPLSNRRAFYDTSFALPPAMLESYIEKWPAPHIQNFLFMLRSGMMGWMSLMLDTTQWTVEERNTAHHAIDLYKRQLRPLIRQAQLYHVSQRPDGIHWDGLQYWDPSTKHGVLYAFRGSISDEPQHRFFLKGLSPEHRYRLHFEDATMTDATMTGEELMREGLTVKLNEPLSSELVFLQQQ